MNLDDLVVDPAYLTQAYGAIRTLPPTQEDLENSVVLQAYMDAHFPTETSDQLHRRSVILADLRFLFRTWVKDVCIAKGLSEEMAKEAGGHILVSGSYRLGVNEPGADIDTICIAPRHIDRSDFFSTLRDRLLQNSKVTNLICIEGAIVPLITFDYEEINIDLQIAILPTHSLPPNLNVLEDSILLNVDGATEKSLNGPRVTELMIKLTPNRESFISVLRIVRRWAKRRGLYSNKLGYLGGINWCILTCFVNQLYPTASPSMLLLRFFMVLANWKWPSAIQLCKTRDIPAIGLEVWNPNNNRNRHHVMPILTPAYPSMNSSVNVSELTLSVMNDEFKRALKIIQDINTKENPDVSWRDLFEPSDFFAVQQHYLAVDIYAATFENQQAWCGYCESRLRKLVESLAYLRPLKKIRCFPKKFPSSFLTPDDQGVSPSHGVSFYVGFDVDKHQLSKKELRIDTSVSYFKQNDLYRWVKRTEDMDVKITPVTWKNLPDFCFDDLVLTEGEEVSTDDKQLVTGAVTGPVLTGREVARARRKAYMKEKREEQESAVAAAIAAAEAALSKKKEHTTDEVVLEDCKDGVLPLEGECLTVQSQPGQQSLPVVLSSDVSCEVSKDLDLNHIPSPHSVPAVTKKHTLDLTVRLSKQVVKKKKMKISFAKK